MNNSALKQIIADDIEAMKSLDIETIPAREYYGNIFKLIVGGIWKLGLIACIAIMFSSIRNPTHPLVGLDAYLETMLSSAMVAFFMALVAMILLGAAINHYFLIRHYLKNRLKTGELLVKKLQQSAYFFLSIFAVLCLVFAGYAESAAIIFMVGLAFIISAVVTYLAISMEMNRIGMGVLFTLMSQCFNKNRPKVTDHA